MKLQSNQTAGLLKSLPDEQMKFLTLEVKETVCMDFKNERKRIFSAAQLWDIQRRRKNASFQKGYL
ncbi:MAG TPA: hypothetical protein VFU62_09115 [Hanamia sp.]|jgi:hypothetical protein|nr:hypothetical protein [Hanamia sp.]